MAQLGSTVVNGNLRVIGDIYGTDHSTGLESTTSGNTLTFVGVPNNSLVRLIMMNTAPTLADTYIIIQNGSVTAIKPTGTGIITNYSYDSNTQTLTLTIRMDYSPNR